MAAAKSDWRSRICFRYSAGHRHSRGRLRKGVPRQGLTWLVWGNAWTKTGFRRMSNAKVSRAIRKLMGHGYGGMLTGVSAQDLEDALANNPNADELPVPNYRKVPQYQDNLHQRIYKNLKLSS